MPDPLNVGNPYSASLTEVMTNETLTGEALLMYLDSRLGDLDGDIQGLMGEAEKSLARKEYVNEVRDWAGKVVAARNAGNEARVQELMDEFPEAPPGERDLQVELRQAFGELGVVGNTEDDLQHFNAKLDQVMDEINGQSEIAMIRLQQLMGQRQVAVQLATNCMSTFNQTDTSISSNI